MASLFCCTSIQPFRPQTLSHEGKFKQFMSWAPFPREASTNRAENQKASFDDLQPKFAVQLVRQVNYGPLEAKRYFIPTNAVDGGGVVEFVEVKEGDLVQANFQKLNSYKNFKCELHNKFFEVNLYQKDPVNTHHWRANIARPADSIDL